MKKLLGTLFGKNIYIDTKDKEIIKKAIKCLKKIRVNKE